MTDAELQALRAENAERRKRKEVAKDWIDDLGLGKFARTDPVEGRIDALLAEVERLTKANLLLQRERFTGVPPTAQMDEKGRVLFVCEKCGQQEAHEI